MCNSKIYLQKMPRKFKNNRGFSLLEIILVIFIIAILSASVMIWFFNYQRQVELDSGAKMIVNILRDAQSRSMSGKDFKLWGVYFDSINNKAVLFRNDSGGYAGAIAKEDNVLSIAIKINGESLAGGCNEIIFNNRGYAAQNCTIKIEEAANSGNFKNIIITQLGRIER